MSWNTSSSTISASHRRLDRPNGSTTLELRTNAKQRAQRDRASTGSDERDTNDLRADACGSTRAPLCLTNVSSRPSGTRGACVVDAAAGADAAAPPRASENPESVAERAKPGGGGQETAAAAVAAFSVRCSSERAASCSEMHVIVDTPFIRACARFHDVLLGFLASTFSGGSEVSNATVELALRCAAGAWPTGHTSVSAVMLALVQSSCRRSFLCA